jgi:hypothetical protein
MLGIYWGIYLFGTRQVYISQACIYQVYLVIWNLDNWYKNRVFSVKLYVPAHTWYIPVHTDR